MASLKNHDFVEIEYTGKLKENNAVFDTTNEEIAKKEGLYSKNMSYGPIVVCVGEQQIIAGLDKALVGKELGSYTIEVKAEDGFGKKDAKLVKLVPMNVFKKNQIMPMPGLSVNIDNAIGTVKTVSGGRVLVDFNHPLSGKDLIYDVKITRIIDDPKEKIKAFFKMSLRQEVEVNVENNQAIVELGFEFPPEIKEKFEKRVAEITGIEKVSFKKKETKTK